MAKLPEVSSPGFNARANNYIKTMRVSDIIIDPEISKVFEIQERIRKQVLEKIKNKGFDRSQPLTIQKGTNILLDGHTRLEAAKEAGLDEVPVVEMDFDDREAAVTYTFERQAVRRNLTNAEIFGAIERSPSLRSKKGEGRMADKLAEELGLSRGTVYNAKRILRDGPPEIVQAVRFGKVSIKEGAGYIKGGAEMPTMEEGSPSSKRQQTRKQAMPELNSRIQTAHEKIGAALNYVTESACQDLLGEALDCLKSVEQELVHRYDK